MINDKKLMYLKTIDGIDFYEYKVRLFDYFYSVMGGYEKLFSRMIRESIDYIRGGYHVVYMGIGEKLIGYGVVTRGGGRNLFCCRDDMVLCSLWIQESERGHGYANTLVKVLSFELGYPHKKVYEYIRHDNIPSIKVALANDFEKVGNASYKGLLKRIVPNENGHLGIYEKNNDEE